MKREKRSRQKLFDRLLSDHWNHATMAGSLHPQRSVAKKELKRDTNTIPWGNDNIWEVLKMCYRTFRALTLIQLYSKKKIARECHFPS